MKFLYSRAFSNTRLAEFYRELSSEIRNRAETRIIASENLPQDMIDICYDAQTSGGLLISIAENNADNLLTHFMIDGITAAAIIGEITQKVQEWFILLIQAKELFLIYLE